MSKDHGFQTLGKPTQIVIAVGWVVLLAVALPVAYAVRLVWAVTDSLKRKT
jgi:hypothetical protein